MSSIIQKAFIVEACINVLAIIPLLFYPERTISYFLTTPIHSSEINLTTILLVRITGVFVLVLTPQLFLTTPQSKAVAAKRQLVYINLGAGEFCLIPLLVWEAFRATDTEKLQGAGGFSRRAALFSAANLLPPLLWRIWVWIFRPEWFSGDAQGSTKTD